MTRGERSVPDRGSFALLTGVMAFIAFFSGMTGIMAVSIKESLSVTDTALSGVFFAATLGFMLFQYVAGKILSRCHKDGSRREASPLQGNKGTESSTFPP